MTGMTGWYSGDDGDGGGGGGSQNTFNEQQLGNASSLREGKGVVVVFLLTDKKVRGRSVSVLYSV